MNKKGNWFLDGVLGVLVIFIIVFLAIHFGAKDKREFCLDNNYSTQNEYMIYSMDNVEEGYISCCNKEPKKIIR